MLAYVDFCACPYKNVVELDANGKKACCHVAGAFLSKLELICSISTLQDLQNVKKKLSLHKSSRSQWAQRT